MGLSHITHTYTYCRIDRVEEGSGSHNNTDSPELMAVHPYVSCEWMNGITNERDYWNEIMKIDCSIDQLQHN